MFRPRAWEYLEAGGRVVSTLATKQAQLMDKRKHPFHCGNYHGKGRFTSKYRIKSQVNW